MVQRQNFRSYLLVREAESSSALWYRSPANTTQGYRLPSRPMPLTHFNIILPLPCLTTLFSLPWSQSYWPEVRDSSATWLWFPGVPPGRQGSPRHNVRPSARTSADPASHPTGTGVPTLAQSGRSVKVPTHLQTTHGSTGPEVQSRPSHAFYMARYLIKHHSQTYRQHYVRWRPMKHSHVYSHGLIVTQKYRGPGVNIPSYLECRPRYRLTEVSRDFPTYLQGYAGLVGLF
jgi:hypothetical protein